MKKETVEVVKIVNELLRTYSSLSSLFISAIFCMI